MRVSRAIQGAVAAACLTSCAHAPHAAQADWANGARRAWVVQTVDGAGPSPDLPSCLQRMAPDNPAVAHLVKVRYWRARRVYTDLATAPADLPLRDGDEVEYWPADCAHGRLPRVSRVLAASPVGQ